MKEWWEREKWMDEETKEGRSWKRVGKGEKRKRKEKEKTVTQQVHG